MQKSERQSVSRRVAPDRPLVLLSRLTRAVAPVLAAAVVAGVLPVQAQASAQPAEKTAEIPLRRAASTAEQKEEQPQYRYALSDKVSLSDTDAAERMLFQENSEVKENATGLYIDGKFIGALRNAQTLQNLLNSLLNSAKNNAHADSASFVDDIQMVTGQYARSSIVTLNAMCSLLQGNRTQPRTYTISSGDTLERIAQKNAVSTSQLTQANPDLKFDSLHAGDVIQLEPSQKVLSIRTQCTSTETSTVPYQKVTQETADLYVGETKVQTGVEGSKTTTYRVTKVDGMLMKKEAVTTQQTKAPVNEVTLVGVRPRPDQQTTAAGVATGTFIWPTPTLSTITSGYEGRWGTFHYGLDISGANAAGQPIVAADGGTVAFAGSDDSGYGTYVIIDHGNGYRSYYGHMTKTLVQTGEKVAQGQLIGLVGSTGDSTGPHCHFEVRKGDDHIDPTKLVNVDRNVVTPYVGQTLETEAVEILATEAKKQSDQSIADYQKAVQLAAQKNAAEQEEAAAKTAEEAAQAKQVADQEAAKEAAEKASEEEIAQQAAEQAAEQPPEETSKKEQSTQPIPVQTS